MVGTLIAPRALDAVKKILGPSIEKITSVGAGKAGGVLGKATPWVTRARKAWDVIRDVPVVGEAAEAGAQAALKRAPEVIAAAGKKAAEKVPGELGETLARGVGAVKKQAEAAASGAGQAVDELTGHVLTGSGRAALQGYVGGGAGAAVAAYAGYEAKHRLLHLGDLAMNKVIPSAKVAALDRLTDADWKEAGEEIAHMDSGGLEALIRLQTPREVPDQITAAIVKQLTTAVDYLQKENPATKPTTRVPTGRDLEPTTQQKERYLRQVKAVLQPSTVLESFTRGDLHRDQVQAMEAVHPQALGQVRDIIRAEVAGRRAAGETYSRRRGNLIATMLGEPEAKPKMYDAKNVAMLQQLHAATRASQQQQTKGQPGSRAEAEATQIQRIHGGRA